MTDPDCENVCLKFHWAFVFMPNVSSLSLPIFMAVIILDALQELTPGPSQVKAALLLCSSQPPGGAQGRRCFRRDSQWALGREFWIHLVHLDCLDPISYFCTFTSLSMMGEKEPGRAVGRSYEKHNLLDGALFCPIFETLGFQNSAGSLSG